MSVVIPSSAQTLDRGEINGTIRDESGAVLPGVAVTLRDTKTGFERNTVSAAAGQYSGLLLPLGVYVVQAELAGFSLAKSDPLPLTVGQALVVNLVMKVAAVTETVDVSAAPGNTAPALGTVIDDTAIANLPINGRDYRDFALLSPTARSITGTRGTFRVAGQPGDYLALNVDGADFTNNFFGEFFGSIETKNFTHPSRGRPGIRSQRRRARRAVGAIQRRTCERRHEIGEQREARLPGLFPPPSRPHGQRCVRKPADRAGSARRWRKLWWTARGQSHVLFRGRRHPASDHADYREVCAERRRRRRP